MHLIKSNVMKGGVMLVGKIKKKIMKIWAKLAIRERIGLNILTSFVTSYICFFKPHRGCFFL